MRRPFSSPLQLPMTVRLYRFLPSSPTMLPTAPEAPDTYSVSPGFGRRQSRPPYLIARIMIMHESTRGLPYTTHCMMV
jgi:hypothetical protein